MVGYVFDDYLRRAAPACARAPSVRFRSMTSIAVAWHASAWAGALVLPLVRGHDLRDERQGPDHSASLGDSITSALTRFSVHTGSQGVDGDRYHAGSFVRPTVRLKEAPIVSGQSSSVIS
jgi:hypothetical protein